MKQIDPTKILEDGNFIYYKGHKYVKEKSFYDKVYELIEDKTGNTSDADYLTDRIMDLFREMLPKYQSDAGSQNDYVSCSVEGYNDAIKEIERKLKA